MKRITNSPPKAPASLLPAVTAALLALGFITSARAELQTAGDLYVNVDATAQPVGSLPSIPNAGTLGGLFEARGGGATVPGVTTIAGVRAITFDGSDFLQLVSELGGAVIPTPAGLVGSETSTIEVWAYNPAIDGEETLVSWGKRGGGPDGSNMSFNFGTDGRWGSVGHWGGSDMGWADSGGAPTARLWHHLVYTYDGTTQKVFSDGVLLNQEAVGLAIHGATSIQLAAQLDGNGTTVTGGLRGSLSIAKVRIHNDALTDAQVKQNFDEEKSAFNNRPAPLALSAAPIHRYSFNEADAADATGLAIKDSVGTAHGTIVGAGSAYAGNRLVLAGGGNDAAAYGDLPNGLLSVNSTNNGGSGQITIEGWVKVTGNQGWARIFDFGVGSIGEVTAPQAGVGPGLDYLFYGAQVGPNLNVHRVEVRNAFPVMAAGAWVDNIGGTTPGEDFHFVVTWDEATGMMRTYENGVPLNSRTIPTAMSDINDVNVWLGRSQWDDFNLQGEFDEFRIYNRVIGANEVSGNYNSGPNVVNLSEAPVSFVSQPASVVRYESFTAEFIALASGAPPISYQWFRSGVAIPGANGSSYSINPVAVDSGATFSCVVSNRPNGVPTARTSDVATLTVLSVPAPVLKNQYTFNQVAGVTVATDIVGGQDGTVVGNGTYAGGKLTLDGSSAYVNLPNDIVLPYSSITIEAWVQDDGSGGWARIYDFGNSTGGEDFAIGSGTSGLQYMFLSAPSGLGNLRGAYTLTGGGAGEQLIEQPVGSLPVGQLKHVVWTTSGDAKAGRLYVDGVQVGENRNLTITPAGLGSTLNNWLGRAQFNDPLFRGQFDEFRIWNGFMLPAQVASSFAAGPETAAVKPRLTITLQGDNVVVSWPEWTADAFPTLEKATTLSPADWQTAPGDVVLENGSFKVTIPHSSGARFFRLITQ